MTLNFFLKYVISYLAQPLFHLFSQLSIALYCSDVHISMHFNLAIRIKGKYYLWPALDLCYLHHPRHTLLYSWPCDQHKGHRAHSLVGDTDF